MFDKIEDLRYDVQQLEAELSRTRSRVNEGDTDLRSSVNYIYEQISELSDRLAVVEEKLFPPASAPDAAS